MTSIREISKSANRLELWEKIISEYQVRSMAEVGVFKGVFAEQLLRRCSSIQRYIMIDPWKHLSDWNKPANQSQDIFEGIFSEAKRRTEFAKEKIQILRETTRNAAKLVENGSLDFVYIDGDHTLRGITIDLLLMFEKVKDGGIIGGDDFTSTIWQHGVEFDPTFVCPFAIYFAEAMNVPIYGLPYNQFLIIKDASKGFEFVDLDGRYGNLRLNELARRPSTMKRVLVSLIPPAVKKSIKKVIGRT